MQNDEIKNNQPALQQANVVGCSGHKAPYDRYHQTALFLCGYFKIPSERVEELSTIIRSKADQEKPYELVHCQKCHTDIEIEFYEPEEDDDECSEPHFYCPKCFELIVTGKQIGRASCRERV